MSLKFDLKILVIVFLLLFSTISVSLPNQGEDTLITNSVTDDYQLERVNQINPNASIKVGIDGNFDFLIEVSRDGELLVYDASSHELLQHQIIDDELFEVQLVGSDVFARGQDKIHVYDLSSSGELTYQSSIKCNCFNLPGKNMEIQGDELFLVSARNFTILDISSIGSPSIISQVNIENGSQIRSIDYGNDKVAISLDQYGLQLYDVSNRDSPQLLDKSFNHTKAIEVEFYYDYLVSLDRGDYVKIFNTGGGNLDYISDIYLDTTTHEGISIYEDELFLFSDYGDQRVYNLTNPDNPTYISSFGDSRNSETEDHKIIWPNLYKQDWADGIEIYDISDLENIYLKDRIRKEYLQDLSVQGDYAYIVDDNLGFKVIDISNPSSPRQIFKDSGTQMHTVEVNQNFAYVTGNDLLRIYNVTDKDLITKVNEIDLAYREGNMVFYEDFMILDYYNNVSIFNVSNPVKPTLVSTIEHLNTAEMRIYGDLLFASSSYERLDIINITNIRNPIVINYNVKFETGKEFHDFAVSNDVLYLVDRNTGIDLFNISDLENIKQINVETYYSNGLSLRIHEDILYSAEGYRFRMFNISQRTTPDLMGEFHSKYIIRTIDFYEGLYVMRTGYSGMVIYNLTKVTSTSSTINSTTTSSTDTSNSHTELNTPRDSIENDDSTEDPDTSTTSPRIELPYYFIFEFVFIVLVINSWRKRRVHNLVSY